jgi:cytochrome c oxidase cbb3-type subunit 3
MTVRAAVVRGVAFAAAAACSGRAGGGAGETVAAAPPSVRYEQHVAAGGVEPPAGQLDNPFRGDARSAAEGEQLFRTMNCDGCHGGGATGWVGPSLISGRWRYGGADGVVYQSVFYGRPEGMPAFGGILAPALIWKIVTYLKSLPPPKAVPTQSW